MRGLEQTTLRAPLLSRFSPDQNQLLAVLPMDELDRLAPHFELVALPLGTVLYEPGVKMRHVYFPIDCVVSLHYITASGASAETAGVGHEGMIGIALFMGGGSTASSAMVQVAGHAWRLPAQVLKEEFERMGTLHGLLLRYALALVAQTGQSVVCTRHHSVGQQLARWLLLSLDRIPSGELVMTHELVAYMLGVRREGITAAAGKLQSEGLIRYRRGHISVLNRVGLQAHACECYAVVKGEFARLLSDVTQRPADQPSSRSVLQGQVTDP
jgi:CRP-like cAMP-binding protein